MLTPNLFLLYVADPAKSCAFYEKLFGVAPKAQFPTFVDFEFENGTNLGLWSTGAESFVSGGTGHRAELAVMVRTDDEVRRLYDEWQAAGVEIEQPLGQAVFGWTFVATDPDGHRIRVCTPDD